MALEAKIKDQLNQYLTKIVFPVSIDAYTNKEPSSSSMVDLLEELSGMSDKVSLNIYNDSNERTPSFKVNKPNLGNYTIECLLNPRFMLRSRL